MLGSLVVDELFAYYAAEPITILGFFVAFVVAWLSGSGALLITILGLFFFALGAPGWGVTGVACGS